MAALETLCKELGYGFKDQSLLVGALTHRSVPKENNERLEYLGDALLSFIIAEALYTRYPKLREGKLTRLRAGLVNGEALAELGQQFNLGQYLKLGVSEQKSGGHRRHSIIADALEAIIAAIYLDSDEVTCKAVVLNWYETRLATCEQTVAAKDPKTQLQELLQARHMNLPTYQVVETLGSAHETTFVVECKIENIKHNTVGRAKSRRKAEQQAAVDMLAQL